MAFAGSRDHYQSALALQENGALERLVTDVYFPDFLAQTGLLGKRFHRLASLRHHPDLPSARVRSSLLAFYYFQRARFEGRADSRHFAAADRALGLTAARVACRRRCPLVAYSYYATSGFRAMEGEGLPRLLFQVHPSGRFLREIYMREIEKVPEARSSLMGETEMSPSFVDNDRAFEMADGIICASTFTRRSLTDSGAKAPTVVVPYGVDIEAFVARSTPPHNGPLTIGFVGSFNQRKGARYLLEALSRFPRNSIRLVIFTRSRPNADLLRGFEHLDIEVRGGLNNAELAKHLQQCDLTALPSIAEGFGLVILESMACGVPVLCTTSTAGSDIIESGRDGYVVPAGEVEPIQAVFQWGLTHRDELFEVGQAARRKAEQLTWARYRQEFFAAYRRLLPPS